MMRSDSGTTSSSSGACLLVELVGEIALKTHPPFARNERFWEGREVTSGEGNRALKARVDFTVYLVPKKQLNRRPPDFIGAIILALPGAETPTLPKGG